MPAELIENGEQDLRWAMRLADVARQPRILSGRWLRALLRDSAISVAGVWRGSERRPVVRCLYLHYVYDDQVSAFRRLLQRLLQLGPFISTSELLEVASGARTPPAPAFHLSFDDGFDNVYRNAFPVLQDLGVHAALLLPSSLIGRSDSDILSAWWMRGRVPHPTRLLRWEWVREMSSAGHEIGSHTRTHARLSAISADRARLLDEVTGSKLEIESAVGKRCRVIAWPYGTAADVDQRSMEAVAEAGYEACFSAIRGRVRSSAAGVTMVPRHHFEPEWPWRHVRYFACGGRER